MPFSGPGDSKLPERIQSMSLEKRRQWVGAWNGRFEQCRNDGGNVDDCESSAFAVANAAIKEMDMEQQVSQEEAAYTTDGGLDGNPCAACRWFVAPGGCLIVANWPEPILPTGSSNRFERKIVEEPEPIRVTMVEEGESEITDRSHSMTIRYNHKGERLGRRLRSLLDERGWTLDEFASAVNRDLDAGNITASTLGQIVRGEIENPSRPVMAAMASALNVSQDSLLSLIDRDAAPETARTGQREANILIKVPVNIRDSFKKSLETWLASFKSDDTPQSDLILFNDKDGRLRWFMVASNKYRDRDDPPEIFTEAAHKEFVKYLDNGGAYPEAWLWHTPGTRWGVADWADYSDGFLMYSGVVDEGMEGVAQSLAQTKGLGVSHGYEFRYSDKERGIIGWYRDFEVSALPASRAANQWTGLEILAKEIDMGFSDAKRAFLVTHLGEDKVADLEGNTEQLKKELDALGIEWKDVPDADADDASDEADKGIDYTRIGTEAVKAMEESEGFKALGEKVDGFEARLAAVEGDVKALKQSDDEKIAAKIAPKNDPTQYHRPSQDDANVVNGASKQNADQYLEKRGPIAPDFVKSIMGEEKSDAEAETTPA